jgi:hypothetical protein
MMKALHKVKIMKRETTVFTKSKHPFIHKLGIIHKVTLWVTRHLYKWSRWNPPIKNKMGMRTLFSRCGRI